jgi:hypothetical protein
MLGVSQINKVQAHSLFSTTNYLTLFLDKGWCTYRKQLALHHTSSYTKHNEAYKCIPIISIILYIRLDTNGADTNICMNIWHFIKYFMVH